jgi:hypothetical protein
MKKIIHLLVFLIMINTIMAQNIGIHLIEYHPDTNYARVQISNSEGRDLTGITLQVGSGRVRDVVGVLKDGDLVNAVMNMPPGERLVTVKTKEGVEVSKTVSFSSSKADVINIKEKELEEIKREAELKKKAQENLKEAEAQIQEEREKAIALGVVKEKPNMLLIGGIIVVVMGIIVLLWLILKEKNK